MLARRYFRKPEQVVAAFFVRASISTSSLVRIMDWATNDYTQVYADTFVTSPDDSGAGIYLEDTIEPREDCREGFYRGRKSSRRGYDSVRGVAWDERPEQARLIPPLNQRPNRGTYLRPRGQPVAPIIPPSPYLHRERACAGAGGGACAGAGGGACACAGAGSGAGSGTCSCGRGNSDACSCGRTNASKELSLQYVKVFLLIVVVVLLAMTLMAAGKLALMLEGLVNTAVSALSNQPV